MGLIMRRNLMAAKSGPTAKDYVQDGLIAMWDGIENAGWGVHDPNATVWKDLVGENDLTVQNAIFLSDSLHSSGGKSAVGNSVSEEIYTLECCFILEKYDWIWGNGRILVSTGSGYDNRAIWGFGAWNNRETWFGIIPSSGYRKGYACDERLKNNKKRTITFTYSEDNVIDFYYNYDSPKTNLSNEAIRGAPNGQIIIGAGIDGREMSSPYGIYSLRLYSRVLSNLEIKSNYAIDKARFNLPDEA